MKLINNEEAANIFNIKPNTLSIWRSKKKINLPFYKIGNLVKYDEDEVHKYLKSLIIKPQIECKNDK